MFRRLLWAGLALALATSAGAQPRAGDPPRPGPDARPRRGLFISPSGEPFRGGDGPAAWFAQADADHDGALTFAEFQTDALRFFKVLDANGDGRIDGFEIQAYERDIAPEITRLDLDRGFEGGGERGERRGMGRGGGRRANGGRPMGAGREGAARFSLINEPEPVAIADADLDGRVTLDEWTRATRRRFEALDKAKTGRLTLEALTGGTPKPLRPDISAHQR